MADLIRCYGLIESLLTLRLCARIVSCQWRSTVEIRKPFIVIVIVIKAMPSNHMPEQDVRAHLIIQITHHVHSVTFREYLLNCVK